MRLRQAVLAASDLDAVANRLRAALGLREPYSDPAVAAFGLRNAVFALGDTFLEVVSPVQEDTAAGRWLARRGDDCGYMAMFEVDDLAAARRRTADQHVREVFELQLDDIAEVHLHPVDVGAAIVALSAPQPPGSWRWGGPGWQDRSSALRLTGVTVSVADPAAVANRWSAVLGRPAANLGVDFTAGGTDAGIVEITLAGPDDMTLNFGGVTVRCTVT